MLLLPLFCILITDFDLDTLLEMPPQEIIKTIEADGQDPYDYGMNIFVAGKPKDAERFFHYLTAGKEGRKRLNLLYGKAWIHYTARELDLALREADHILYNSGDRLLLARSHYLIALVHDQRDISNIALRHYKESLVIYEELGKKGGMQRCYLRMSDCYNRVGNSEKALQFLNLGKTTEAKDARSRARLADAELYAKFANKDYAGSIVAAMTVIDAWSGLSEFGVVWAHAHLAYSYARIGKYNQAYEYATLVEESEISDFQEQLRNFNNITWLYLARCRGYNTDALEAELRDDKDLSNMLEQTLNAPCLGDLK